MRKVRYYNTYEDDFVESKNQNYKLKQNFKWMHTNFFYKVFSFILYILVLIISFLYSKLILRVSIKNKKVLKKVKGYYIYSNHTQILGDVLNPFLISFPKHPYIVCSPSNLGIPIIGRLLPMLGALPIPDSIHDKKKLFDSIYHYSKKGSIVIYPEAHLWPWYTKIREFPNTSFNFPVKSNLPVFTATTTYKKSKIFKRPKINIYIDGPFNIDSNLSKKENVQYLHDIVYDTMVKRSIQSNYDYIVYKKINTK